MSARLRVVLVCGYDRFDLSTNPWTRVEGKAYREAFDVMDISRYHINTEGPGGTDDGTRDTFK